MPALKNGNEALLRCQNISLRFGGVNALLDINFQVKRGEIVSIIGPNGAGKTCMINTITGFYRPSQGKVYFKEREISGLPPHKICQLGIARTFQNIELFTGLSVLDNLLAARHLRLKPNLFSCSIYFGLAQREEIKQRNFVEHIIEFLEMETIRKQEVRVLPYGHRKRVELGRALRSTCAVPLNTQA